MVGVAVVGVAVVGAAVEGASVRAPVGALVTVVMEGDAVNPLVGDGVTAGTSNVIPKLTVLSSPPSSSKHSVRLVSGSTALSTPG